jgi:SAM-dependent methyltransferase
MSNFRKSKTSWFTLLVVVGFLLVIIAGYNAYYRKKDSREGFTQNMRYLLKRNGDIYDEFYVEVFDIVYQPPTYIDAVIGAIERTTAASNASVFLDVGSKTGKVVDALHAKGYAAYGVEPSDAMMTFMKEYHPSAAKTCQRGDMLDSILYERGSFSHITCLHHVIYQYKDKVAFLRNCYFWLRSGGTLAIQVMEFPREKKNENGKRKKGLLAKNPNQVQFPAFQFSVSYEIVGTEKGNQEKEKESQEMILTETFVDKSTMNIRENEQMLYMESTASILNQASFCRFAVQGKMELPAPTKECECFLYFLERIN